MAGNVVEIVIRARTSVREGFEEARKEAQDAGVDSGESYTDRFVATFATRVRQRIAAPLGRVGDEIGERLGEGTARGIAQVVAKGIAAVPGQVEDEADKAGEEIGQRMGETSGRSFVQRMRESFSSLAGRIRGTSEAAGRDIGNDIVRGIDGRLRDKITGRYVGSGGSDGNDSSRSGGLPGGIDVDRDRGSILSRMLSLGKDSAKAFSQGFGNVMTSFFSGDLISLLLKVLAGGALIAVLAPAIGAAISTAVLLGIGGGFLGLGISQAFKDPQIAAATKELGEKFKKIREEFGKPFVPYLAIFLDKLAGFADRLAPKLKDLAGILAPLVGSLGQGLIEMLEAMLPDILKAAEASKPLFETLAKHMPALGEALGKFFTKISEGAPGAVAFFDDLLSAIEVIITTIGTLVSWLSTLYLGVSVVGHAMYEAFFMIGEIIKNTLRGGRLAFNAFKNYVLDVLGALLAGAARALSWIPGIGPKLKEAERRFNDFRKDVNSELSKIRDRNVTITIETLGLAAAQAAVNVANILGQQAHGGIVGQAASGGMRSGLTLVGEHGPELAQIAPGGRVWSNPDTQRMLSEGGGGRGGGEVEARWEATGNEFLDALAGAIRLIVKQSGNSVTNAFEGR